MHEKVVIKKPKKSAIKAELQKRMEEKEKAKKKSAIKNKDKKDKIKSLIDKGLMQTVRYGTGEILDLDGLHLAILTEEEFKESEDKRIKDEIIKKWAEVQKYRKLGRKDEHFAQLMPTLETTIFGKYKKQMTNCLFQTIPLIHYNSKDFNNKVIKINGEPATQESLTKFWGVGKTTTNKYINQLWKDFYKNRRLELDACLYV